MGIFDFVKDAGEALAEKVGGSTDAGDISSTVEVSPERLDQLRGAQIAGAIAKLQVEGEQVSVDVNDSVAVLSGTAPSQEALEKIVLCAGNQHGIGRVDCQLQVDATVSASTSSADATAPSADVESMFYTVQSGDTLGKIAQEHYGAASKYTIIFEANQPMLSDPDKIYPGQKLRIPAI